MTDWNRHERTTTEVVYTVPTHPPWGADWNQIYNAIIAATDEYERMYEHKPWDNSIHVHPGDDEITIVFEKKKESR